MPNYKGRRPNTRRVVIWKDGRPLEWVIEGSKKEADAFEARKRVELEVDKPATRTAPSFSEFSTLVYGPHAERHLRKSTWNLVRVYQVATLAAFFGDTKLTALSTKQIEDYKTWRLKTPSGPRKVLASATSINNELRVLGTMLKHAKKIGYPCANVSIDKLPVSGAPRVSVWSADEMARFYAAAHIEAPELVPMLAFLANTGCRKGEALAAEWSWVDERRSLLCIPVNEVWRPKSGKPREVPLSPAVRAALAGPRRHERWLFPTIHGGRYAAFPQELFARIRKRAGLSGGAHTLRHTFASHFLAAVPDMFLLAKILGHSHQRVTELYSHLLPGHLERAMNAVSLLPETMAGTMAKEARRSKRQPKPHQRH